MTTQPLPSPVLCDDQLSTDDDKESTVMADVSGTSIPVLPVTAPYAGFSSWDDRAHRDTEAAVRAEARETQREISEAECVLRGDIKDQTREVEREVLGNRHMLEKSILEASCRSEVQHGAILQRIERLDADAERRKCEIEKTIVFQADRTRDLVADVDRRRLEAKAQELNLELQLCQKCGCGCGNRGRNND